MRGLLLIILILTGLGAAVTEPARAAADGLGPCRAAIDAAERIERLPRLLLHAVSLAESGRWDPHRQASVAWPWTVNNGGEAKYLPSRDAAIALVRRLRAKGETNIDVGCMQINLKHHGAAFASLEEAIDPIHNVAYAARLLKKLRRDTGAWAHAIGQYHNAGWRTRGQPYWRRVRALWVDEQKSDFRKRREARLRDTRKRRRRRESRR
ncbi:MAG: transglycosylase SLT domain-containing protein [Alphaproteobacteria bacterium]